MRFFSVIAFMVVFCQSMSCIAANVLSGPSVSSSDDFTLDVRADGRWYMFQREGVGGDWEQKYVDFDDMAAGYFEAYVERSGFYYFRFKSCPSYGGGACSFSNTIMVAVELPNKPPEFHLDSPQISLPSTDSDGQYTVAWNAVENAEYYYLEEYYEKDHEEYLGDYNGKYFSTRVDVYGNDSEPLEWTYGVKACALTPVTKKEVCSSYTYASIDVRVEYKLSAPTISATAIDDEGRFELAWSFPYNTRFFRLTEYFYENGVLVYGDNSGDYWSIIHRLEIDNITVSGKRYYKGQACREKALSSGVVCSQYSNTVVVDIPVQSQETEYRYDALGRLIKIYEDGVIRSHYCYDDAGNRIAAGEGGSGDICPGPAAPTGLSVSTYRGAFVAHWNKVDSASYYLIKHTSPSGSVVARVEGRDSTSFDYAFTDVNQTYSPIYLQACNANACSEYVYF